MRQSVGIALSGLVVVLLLMFGRGGDGPDWLTCVWVALAVAMSVVIPTGRRTPREWVVLVLLAAAAVAILLFELG